MNHPSSARRPGAFSSRAPSSPGLVQSRPESAQSFQSSEISESDSSSSSQVTERSRATQNSPFPQHTTFQRPSITHQPPSSNASSTSITNFARPALPHVASERELLTRKNSPLITADGKSHRRQHSQGFFEPTLPSLPSSSTAEQQTTMAGKNASQIAAQAAMQHQSNAAQHMRKRSQTVPSPQMPPDPPGTKRKPAPIQTGSEPRRPSGGQPYSNGSVGIVNAAAATAANVAYPKSAPLSPGLTSFDFPQEKDHKLHTQRSKMKLFSNKPKQISINSALESRDRPMPSPNKIGQPGQSSLGKLTNASVTSFADSLASGASSIYMSNNNASTSTLIPADRPGTATNERERKHHFLSRQKNKLKDKLDEHSLPLSSSSSNSRPLDPAAPQPLYSFAAPASPGPSTTSFAKTVSGLDLRHGGRALREKKKEEKAMPTLADLKRAEVERLDWAGTGPSGPVFGTSAPSAHHASYSADIPGQSTLQGFGLNNMSAEDAWDFLRAKLLIIFTEGGELRMPVEDLNKLVSVNIQRCVARRTPNIIIEDLRDLLQTGFASLDHSLSIVPEHRMVPRLVDVWLLVFGTILPYVQAVFLPLDLEFKGRGSIMSPREAADFWGADPDSTNAAFGSEFDVRRIVLLSYRDNVILPRHDTLKATFSRLSLESINPSVSLVSESPDPARPSTAASLDPGLSSFNSQGSTLIGDGNRSRATSNLSAPELPPFASPPLSRRHPSSQQEQLDTSSTQVTETVGRMLQCVSVLASVQSRDESQIKMEALAKELKLNWLGRGRTGRNRRGFVGTRVRTDVHSREGDGRRMEVSAR
ncbi:MAG: hypothetical protein L6R38_009744 [Xanthoria sp. 2 TBL-2021]|nr:MAG: hypothetical protein L6R38_009744 [Xanthoria sp. 2 TBL-2021]